MFEPEAPKGKIICLSEVVFPGDVSLKNTEDAAYKIVHPKGKSAAAEKDPRMLFISRFGTASGKCPPEHGDSWQETTMEMDNMFLPTGKITLSSRRYIVTLATDVDCKDSKKSLVFLKERQEAHLRNSLVTQDRMRPAPLLLRNTYKDQNTCQYHVGAAQVYLRDCSLI